MPQQQPRSRAKRTEQSTDSSASGGEKSTGLTVAVTGPTGEIGISAVTALERDPAVERIIGMARRPSTPPCTVGRRPRISRATSWTGTLSTRSSPMPMSSSILRSSCWVLARKVSGSTSREHALSSRPPSLPRGLPVWSHILGRGLRLLLRQPGSHHRRRSGPRITRARLLRAEGSLRSCARRNHLWHFAGSLRASSVYRRRTEGDRTGRRDAVE